MYVHVLVTRETEYIMAKTHKRPCATGTIHYANEAPPYGESQLSAQHTHAQKHAYVEEPSAFSHFHAKSAKPCNSYLCSVCDEVKKKKRRDETKTMRGHAMDREGRGRHSIEEIRETSQYCLLLLMISIQ